MDTPDTLEVLLGANGNTQQAFLSILLQTLKRLEQGVEETNRKLDAHGDSHNAHRAEVKGQIDGLTDRVGRLEGHAKDRGEGNWRYVQAVLTVLSLLVGLGALLFHH